MVFIKSGASLCGTILYFILLGVLFGNTATPKWHLFDNDTMTQSVILLICALIPWLYMAIVSRAFDDDLLNKGVLPILFPLYYYPGLVIFCLGGVIIVAIPAIIIGFFASIISGSD